MVVAFASPSYRFNKGENAAIDVTFDGQEQARLFATAVPAQHAHGHHAGQCCAYVSEGEPDGGDEPAAPF